MLKRKLTVYSYLAQKKLKRQFRKFSERNQVETYKAHEDYDPRIDDLPLTLNRDPAPNYHQYQSESASL